MLLVPAFFTCLYVLSTVEPVKLKETVITFDLSTYDPSDKSSALQRLYTNLEYGTTEIRVENVGGNVGFIIVQVHTQVHNVTLTSSRDMETGTFVAGTHVGLVAQDVFSLKKSFYVLSANKVFALIAITIYQEEDPIPGGCNLSFDTPIAPYQVPVNTDDLIIVQSQAPSVPGYTCDFGELDNIKIEMFHLYIERFEGLEQNSTKHFHAIENMLTVDGIRANGNQVNVINGYYKYRKIYSSYRGVGQVFAIIASFNNHSSAYVPAVSYGCDLNHADDTCYGPVTPHWKLLCAMLLIFGIFVCFFGHRFFRTTLFLIGFAVGMLITYIILSLTSELTAGESATTSMLIALMYGAVWLLIWWKFGVPVLSASLTFFLGGFVLASTFFYAAIGAELTFFHNDINFWLTLFCIVLAFTIVWVMHIMQGHIYACSLLGSYSCIAALNYYTRGTLQYIFINTFRRITVSHFNIATTDPPFQVWDGIQVIWWFFLAAVGYWYQLREQRGKPPFPPHRYSTVSEGVSETTPLLFDDPPPYSA